MSNFFAALDDSGDEAEVPKISSKVEETATPKAPVVEPSKPDRRRQKNDDRNTKSGRGRPPARDGKRTYDRRSGTGRGREIKKGGGGGRNWGSDKNDAKQAVTEGTETKGKETEDHPVESEEPKSEEVSAEAGEDKKEVEPEVDNTISYEDYLKSKESPESGVLAPVQIKELVNEFQGKATFVANKEETFLVMGGGKNPRKKGNKKEGVKSIVPAFRVGDPVQRDGGRDNKDIRERKGGRGDHDRERRGGRGGGRGDRKGKKTEINTADTDAFPTL